MNHRERIGAFVSSLLLLAAPVLVASDGIKEPKGSKVSVLNRDLFPRFISRNPLVLMEWYAPWCGHCQELAPKYREAADQLAALKKQGELPVAVKLAKMNDGDEYNRAGRFGAPEMYNFSSYPALYIFKDGEMSSPYYGGREVDDIVLWMSAVAKGLDPIEEEIKQRPGLYKKESNMVPDLSPETFNATVKRPAADGNNALWVVEFYSDRCPFCKSLSPEVVKAAEAIAKEVPNARLGACNSRIYHEVAEENAVTGYPWVAAFYNGEKIEDMAGLGGWESIVNFAKRKEAEVFKPELGSPPPLQGGYTYNSEGIMNLQTPEIQQWADADAAKYGGGEWIDRVRAAIKAEMEEEEAAKKPPPPPAPKKESPPPPPPPPPVAAKAVDPVAPAAAAAAKTAVEIQESGEGKEITQEDIDKGAAWRATLGRQTWFFLHTLAAKYPDYPSEVDMRTMRNFVAGLGQHYPCKLCRAHLKEKLMDPSLGPVAVENRTALGVWFCNLHNMVNVDTGKSHYHDCSPFNLDLQYLKDCGECEGPGAPKQAVGASGVDAGAAEVAVFDGRLYAKDEAHLLSEMSEAMDALSGKMASLEAENAMLKARLGLA